ncbi:MAG: SDR family NAD(P)-dependent oxidoreductase [Rickettsiales bacterium]
MARVLIIGATSSLAKEIGRLLAKDGDNLVLAGRNEEELKRISSDIAVRYDIVPEIFILDLSESDFDYVGWSESIGDVDRVIFMSGDMGSGDNNNLSNIENVIRVNFTEAAKLLTIFAEKMEKQESGSLVVISSVAADRGRQSNYIYGSAKAGLTTFASGLRNRLSKKNVHVLTIKPGFIDTPLTYAINSPLTCNRTKAAEIIVKAIKQKKDEIYVPAIWFWIMLIIRNIPEKIFKRLKL